MPAYSPLKRAGLISAENKKKEPQHLQQKALGYETMWSASSWSRGGLCSVENSSKNTKVELAVATAERPQPPHLLSEVNSPRSQQHMHVHVYKEGHQILRPLGYSNPGQTSAELSVFFCVQELPGKEISFFF